MAYCFNIDISKLNIDNCIINYCENIYKKILKKHESFETKIYYENQIKELEKKINLYFKNNNINKNEFNEIDFEKDTTNINEINFIYYCSNLRAKNYNINKEDKIKIKIIAGKIIPSLITSTSSIAGLLALQIYVICQKKNHRNFRTGIIDLSDNTLALGIPESIK
jgi:ubiquitin-activating enzyme E1